MDEDGLLFFLDDVVLPFPFCTKYSEFSSWGDWGFHDNPSNICIGISLTTTNVLMVSEETNVMLIHLIDFEKFSLKLRKTDRQTKIIYAIYCIYIQLVWPVKPPPI